MNNEELRIIKLQVIEKLMNTYTEGTGKEIDHKDDQGQYEIIGFIKESIKILKMMGSKVEIPDKFIEDFFRLLFKFKSD